MTVKKLNILAGVLFGIGLAAALITVETPRPSLAQFSAQSTWVPASGVGGGANAVTLAVPNVSQFADLLGVPIRFLPINVNAAGATTVNVTGLGAIAVKRTSAGSLVPIAGSDFTTGTLAEVVYDGTQFVQTNPATGTAPVGSEISVTAGTAAIAGYLIANGTCISQTTYSALFAFYGNTDVWTPGSTGGACPAGQFHLPYTNGRNSVAADTQGGVTANVLTNAGSGCAATGVAVSCGAQNKQILQANFPNLTLSVNDTRNMNYFSPQTVITGLQTGGAASAWNPTVSNTNLNMATPSSGGISASTGGSGTALGVQNPTYTVLRMIKY